MRKILFNDKFCLTQAVLSGIKTMTRRVEKPTEMADGYTMEDVVTIFHEYSSLLNAHSFSLCNNEKKIGVLNPRYQVGEIVAIAQSYNDIYNELEGQGNDVSNDWWITSSDIVGKGLDTLAGYKNKMFVRSDFMKHHIKITDVKVERLHDISDDDIMREGIREERFAGGDSMFFYNKTFIRDKKQCVEQIYNSTARRAFALLMYKIIGGNTWHSNPFVVAYSFELVD